jgi:hypothetical protein
MAKNDKDKATINTDGGKELQITSTPVDDASEATQTEEAHAPKGEAASTTTHEVGVPQTLMNANINTTQNMTNKISEGEMKRDVERAAKSLAAKKKKSISIPKQMAPILGDTVTSCINGACIRVPVDGESYDIPEPYFEVIKESLKTVNSGDVRSTLKAGANDNFLEVN